MQWLDPKDEDNWQDSLPEELISPPEKRLVGTLLTERPHTSSFFVVAAAVLFIVGFSQLYWLAPSEWSAFLPAQKSKIFSELQLWRLFSVIFIHADLGHLLSNLYMLSIFSYFIYGHFGFRLWGLYSLTGAAVVNLISVSTYADHIRLLGASGWVYLLGGLWVTLYLFIQRQYNFSKRLMRVLGMSLLVFFPTTFEPTTSYRAHLIGFGVGILIALPYYFLNKESIRSLEKYKMIF